MRNVTILAGLLARVALGLVVVGAGLIAWMLLAGSAGWGPWFVGVAVVAIAAAGLRTIVLVSATGIRVLGEPAIGWDEVVDVHLVQDRRVSFPQLTLARGRSLEVRDLDGLVDINADAVRAKVALLAGFAGVTIEDDATTQVGPIVPRRGFDG